VALSWAAKGRREPGGGSVDRRAELLAQIRELLTGVGQTGDAEPVLDSSVSLLAEQLWEAKSGEADVEVCHVLGWLYWCRYLALPQDLGEEDLTLALTFLDVSFLAGVEGFPETVVPLLADRALSTAFGMSQQARVSPNPEWATLGIQLWRRVLDAIAEDDPDRGVMLSELSATLLVRFERTGVLADLDEAVRIGTLAFDGTAADHPGHALVLCGLGEILLARFNRTGVLADLNEALRVETLALDATDEGHPDRAAVLSALGTALRVRFERTDMLADLNEAVRIGTLAADATAEDHPARAAILSNIGITLRLRSERTGALTDLNEAVRIGTLALGTMGEDHPARAVALSSLGAALQMRFKHTGVLADLDEAIRLGTMAVEATAEKQPARASSLSILAVALQTRFGRTGVLADLDEAVRVGTLAVDATPEHDPARLVMLSNLGSALQVRFKRTGALADLDEAIRLGTMAVDSPTENHRVHAMRLNNLGNTLRLRFKHTGVPADLDEAIRLGTMAVEATAADHPDYAVMLSNLCGALLIRFELSGVLTDLDEAVRVGTLAVNAIASNHADRADVLATHGNAMQARFKNTGVLADLDEAIRVGALAVDATAADQPHRCSWLFNLGNALSAHFELTGAPESLEKAVKLYVKAAGLASAPPFDRIRAGRAAGVLLAPTAPTRAADLLEQAVRLLPDMAPDRLFHSDRRSALSGFYGLAADAAAVALLDSSQPEQPRAERALSLLESGRAVLLSQTLGTRSDVTDLNAEHPELALKLAQLRALLDSEPDAGPSASAVPRSADIRARWSAELATTLEQIRALPGFQTFDLPPSIDQLRAHADGGPIVSFTVSTHQSAALILTTEGVSVVPLPGLTYTALWHHIEAFREALNSTHGSPAVRLAANQALLATLAWLWDEAAEPVLDHLGHWRTAVNGQAWPRVWWATGGLLGLLPLHAAGHHEDPPGPQRRTVMDRVVSSYTPTVRALGHARRPRPERTAAASLIVAMPTTPDLPDALHGAPLHHVPMEARRLAEILPHPLTLSGPEPATSARLDGTADTPPTELPTRQRVFSELPGRAIAHFACHGIVDPKDPSNSRLLLHDHRDHPMTVASLAPVNLRTARLAYLSACNTFANHATHLLEEAIHLTGAFQLAGYAHVIGTLWPISDEFAVDVATGFYTALRDHAGRLNTDNAATALHQTLRALIADQDLYTTPWLWAPYIHAGA
jgi:tetratricopeptide (TPR) repeat protein